MKPVIVTVKTKLNKDDKNPKVTVLTFNFDGATVEMLAGPAIDTLTINKQGQWRRAGAIPQKEEVLVTEMIARMGTRQNIPATVEGIAAVSGQLKAEEVADLIKKLQDSLKAPKAPKVEKKAAKTDGNQDRPNA